MDREKIYYQQWGSACFQLTRDHRFQSRIKTGEPCSMEFIDYDGQGNFTLKAGFAYDGASVPDQPTPQTPAEIYLAAQHDAKFRLFRSGLIGLEWLDTANEEMKEDAVFAGMNTEVAEAFYLAVEHFGAGNAKGGNPVLEAP